MAKSYSVKDIMTYNVATFDKRDKLVDAIQMMADHNIRSILIVDKGIPIGIVTEREIMKKVLAKNLNYKNMSCKNIMAPIRSVKPTDSITYVSRLMKELHEKRFPVIDDGRIVGVVNQSDIVNISHILHKKHKEISLHHTIQLLIVVLVILFLIGFFIYTIIM